MTEPRMPIAVADIHGRLDLLDAALAAFPDRTFVLLGDYIDRGPQSAQVIARVRELVESGRAVACMGNHDEWLINVCLDGADQTGWMQNGADATLASYRGDWAAMTLDAQWMQGALLPWHTHGHVLFAHAMRPDQPGTTSTPTSGAAPTAARPSTPCLRAAPTASTGTPPSNSPPLFPCRAAPRGSSTSAPCGAAACASSTPKP